MDCLVEEKDDGSAADVTFLYKYRAGACPKSYGLNVARLARLPEEVVTRAGQKSAEFEEAVATAQRLTEGDPVALFYSRALRLAGASADKNGDGAQDQDEDEEEFAALGQDAHAIIATP